MIYISAQPDQIYFIWQLEIQLRNFHSLGIAKEQIQVLVSYDEDKGLNMQFQAFMEANNHLANFYTYPDLRVEPKYTSSIRLNILKQHFKKYPALEQETLFYHDSDILFSRIPRIEGVEDSPYCYVSDTRNYLDIAYIRRAGSEKLLDDMLRIVGLTKEKLEQEDNQTGGAQYILKGINTYFWEKVEKDAEALYVLMKDYNRQLWEKEYPDKKEFRSKKRGIQAWCADMWAVLWNLWLTDKRVSIHPEMDFSWPYSPIGDWERKAIQHYSGNIEDKTRFFKKNEYLNYVPWYDNALLSIPVSNCSYRIVKLIRARKEELDRKRPVITDRCIVFDGRELTNEQLNQYGLIQAYVQKYVAIDTYLLTDAGQQTEQDALSNPNQLFSALMDNYKRMLWIPLVYTLDVGDIQNILSRNVGNMDIDYYFEVVYKVDSLFVETFSKVLDMDLLHLNKGKFNTETPDSDRCIHYINFDNDPSDREQQLNDLYYRRRCETKKKVALPLSYHLIP